MKNTAFSFEFGPFSLGLPQRKLLRNKQIVPLGSRATDILVALLEANGELVDRDALIAQVWPSTIVNEGALRVHMSSVRKALGDAHEGMPYISNEPGKGYRFIAPIERQHSVLRLAPEQTALSGHKLPGQITPVLGRTHVIERLTAQLTEKRCLTIAGPGGIGKTTVAIGIAQRFLETTAAPVCFIDLAPLADARSLIGALASNLGVQLSEPDAVHEIIAELGQTPRLLLIDNCEHLIEPVATLATRLLQEAPALNLLMTSREPLRIEGEWVHRLASLATPATDMQLRVADALDFAAIDLFVQRAMAVRDGFVLTEANLPAIRDICHQLDGLPLAIELAAARTDWLDVQVIAANMDARLKLLTKGWRTALPRHQTLRATLDWSHDLLSPCAQAVLRRISLFPGGFDFKAMIAVAACADYDEAALFGTASDLIAMSLLTCEPLAGETHYRLLATTRHYAMERLENSGEAQTVRRLHALYCKDLCNESRHPTGTDRTQEHGARQRRQVDDIRCALDWSLSHQGDTTLGIELLAASTALWYQQSTYGEFCNFAEQALAAIARTDLAGTALHTELLGHYQKSLSRQF